MPLSGKYLLILYSAVFQAGGLVVVVVEIFRRNFLASMVPVIVNAILNEHQLVIDIVSFVQKGDFHRSRLGEKQRGKILAGWVTRKMRTIAQYSIRDPNGQDSQMMITEEPGPRASMTGSMLGRMGGPASIKAGSTRAPSLMGMTATMNNLSPRPSPLSLFAQHLDSCTPSLISRGTPPSFSFYPLRYQTTPMYREMYI